MEGHARLAKARARQRRAAERNGLEPEVERKRQDYIDSQMRKETFDIEKGIEILEGALTIGRQAEPLAPETARTRLEAVRGKIPAGSSKADSPLLKKVKSWLTVKLEPAD